MSNGIAGPAGQPDAAPRAATGIDVAEVARFDRLASEWWDPKGKMRPLHSFNPVRLAYLLDTIAEHFGRDTRQGKPLAGLTLLDIGCGGGLLCEPMARLGASVTGLDPAPTNIEVAKIHAARSGLEIDYRAVTAEALTGQGAGFDIVLAMEVVEHVPDVAAFVRTATSLVKPRGLFVAATLNRTLRSFALAIVGAEYVLRWLPVGTHSWDKFVTPQELEDATVRGGLRVFERQGVRYNPLGDRWELTRDMAVNYMIAAERPKS